VGRGRRHQSGRLPLLAKIVHSEFFALQSRRADPVYSTELGIYERGCGSRTSHMSWGHDEYLYHVVKDRLPIEALYMIRYHSFYAWHTEGEYDYLCTTRTAR
jgi:inositol oxygenase